MIRLNGQELALGSFPDGTLLLKQTPPAGDTAQLDWYFDNDRELVALIYLTKHLQAHGVNDIRLFLPYLPNARQDRVKSEEDVFTLKYFAQLLNDLHFSSVTVLDPHSTVSEALIDRIVVRTPQPMVEQVIDRIKHSEGQTPYLFYPDEGASKRYSGMIPLPYAFGIKKRDWKTGKIQGLDVSAGCEAAGKPVLIVDDICARGGTFLFSARKLKELGAKNIYLYISHCEKTILDGELLQSGLLQTIFTTDSICRFTHPQIVVMDCKTERGV